VIRFQDYHRTVVGYHGTRLSVALDIVNRRKSFVAQQNEGDWLGRGIYFWEYAPEQALGWANRRQSQWNEPVAVLGSMIRLGSCLDLLDPANIRTVKEFHAEFCKEQAELGLAIPKNKRNNRALDCAVFEYLYRAAQSANDESRQSVETARGAYVPTAEKNRIFKGSWLYEQSHIQICVRNQACILGTWLHYPSSTGDPNGDEARETSAHPDEPSPP